MEKPSYYKTPLKRRVDIVEFILNATVCRVFDSKTHPFCFYLKIHSFNLNFEHLFEIYKSEMLSPESTYTEEWVNAARKVLKKQETNSDLFYQVVELLCCEVTRTNLFNHLWDGTPVNVTYSFEGCSNGWLSINKFEGFSFAKPGSIRFSSVKQYLTDMPWKTLWKFYSLIVMLNHDLNNHRKIMECERLIAIVLFNFIK